MKRLFYHPPPRLWLGLLAACVLLGAGLIGVRWMPNVTNAASGLIASDPVTAAWEKARAAGSYDFTSDVTQTTIPAATITNVGRASRTDQLRLEGQNNLRTATLEMTLWSGGGSVAAPESGLSVKIADGKTYIRQGSADWQLRDGAMEGIAPQGDLMAYLSALRNVTALGEETRGSAGRTIKFTRYGFAIDGPRFAAYLRHQMEQAARTKGELPANLHFETPLYYRDMTGTGELWVGENGLPLRQILKLQFPPQQDGQVHAQMVVDFSHYGTPQLTLAQLWQGGDISGFVRHLPATLPNPAPLLAFLPMLAAAMLLFYYRRTRALQRALAVAVIGSLVVGPVLTTTTNVRFFDTQNAQAATQKTQQTTTEEERTLQEALGKVAFDPHLNPLENAELGTRTVEAAPGAPNAAIAAAPAALLVDNGVDTDGDTLSDFAEERIGTIETAADSDFDGLKDNVEVNGFTFAGKSWYLNPAGVDSNGDGQGDALEWGLNSDGTLRSTPQDTDSDNTPDLFDNDNDNDAVPDYKDLAPFVKGAATFTEATPLQLKLDNLTPDKPTMVEFQIRPQDAKQLWYAFNVLDWPQDSNGQMRDVDGKTFADLAPGQGRVPEANEANGDLKLVPMLEIRMPTDSANLPPGVTQTVTDSTGTLITRTIYPDLTPFNINVNNLTADGQNKVAYVPLNIVTDEKTGQRVAFSGQMRYQPTGSWANAHSVRLVWVLQGLVDFACDPANATDVAQGCQSDGYIHNQAQVLQSYYDSWSLTGLTVREDHGTEMALIYEDPAVDTNKLDDEAIWALSYVLDHHFVIARDADNNGQRDLTVAEIAQRFDRTRNSGYNEAQRFAVPNILRVEKQSYTTVEQAAAFTAMTETQKILNNFVPAATADRNVKPLIFFAQENNSRLLSLDATRTPGNYVTENGASLTVNMAPSGQTAQTVNVVAGVKWAGYCGSANTPLTWQVCSTEEYWNELERRYLALPSLPDDQAPDWVEARLQLAQLYYTGFSAGSFRIVQKGPQLAAFAYSLDDEATTVSQVRAVFQGLATVPVMATLSFERAFGVVLANAFLKKQGVIAYGRALRAGLKSSKAQVASLQGSKNTDLLAKAVKDLKVKQAGALKFFGSPFATIGGIFTVAAQIASLWPTVPVADRTILGSLSLVTNLAFNVVLTSVEVGMGIRAGTATLNQVLNGTAQVAKSIKIAGAVGLVLSVGVTWGFFIYSAATSGLAAGSPELNKAAVEAIASTLVAVLLFALSLTIVGLIVVLIVAVIDGLLTLICELGVDELRNAPGLGGACFTLTTAAIKGIAYFLYNYDLMVDLGREDLVVTGSPDVTLADPSKGFVAGNELTVTLPVTTTLYHKDADPANGIYIYFYHYLFSADNLRSSTFRYSLTHPSAETITPARNQMNSEWQNVVVDHYQAAQPMYRGQAVSPPRSVTGFGLQPGLNRVAQFYFNMGYAVPAYECFGLPLPPFYVPPVPICYTRENTGNQSTNLQSLQYDIFPATLNGFMATGPKPDNGLGLSWDAAFPSLHDADGDGLFSFLYGGLDNNDALTDTDSDGLTDTYELERRSSGTALSPIIADSDGDGLADGREIELGSDPAIADSDNDGLPDSVELTGWDVTINSQTPFTIRVTSDPTLADSDGDGLRDQAERALAADPTPANRIDKQNRPYHPNVFNTPPVAIFLATNDYDGFLKPGQSFLYTSTVVAYQAMAPGVLTVTAPNSVGGSPNPTALGFDPLTFSGAQTVTQQTNFAVAGNATTSGIALTSTVNTRLPSSGTAGWSWEAVAEELLPAVTAPNLVRDTALAATRPDRQDSYTFAGQTVIPNGPSDGLGHQAGDLLSYAIPGGNNRQLDLDTDALNTDYTPAEPNGSFLRGLTNPSVACNNSGVCLVAWEHLDYCNTLTIDSLKVIAEGNDGVAGVEPLIYLVRDPNDTEPRNGGFEGLWGPAGNGGNDIRSGQMRGPNSNGFPINETFCGQTRLYVSELDGNAKFVPDPTLTEWDGMAFLGSHLLSPTKDWITSKTLDYIGGDGYHIQLNITVGAPPSGQQHVIAAAMLAPDGTISKPQFQLSPTTLSADTYFSPVAASDGTNFLVAWENSATGFGTLSSEIRTRLYDSAGNALTDVQPGIDGVSLDLSGATGTLETIRTPYADLAALWANGNYIVTRQMRPHDGITFSDPNAITSRTIGANGLYSAGSTTTLVTDAANDSLDNHDLAWDPAQASALLVYRATDGKIKGKVYGNVSAGPIDLANAGLRPQADYHPTSQSWLVSYDDSSRVQFRNFTTNLGGSLVTSTQPQFPSQLATNNLVCPAAQSVPVVSLRFEELPGVTTFADASGRGNNATCSGASCPTAGGDGAPNAPLSDYAVQFDGTDDGLTLNRTIQDNFTVAFWLKAPTSTTPQMLVDGGAGQANGFHIWLNNGALAVNVPGVNAQASGRIDDGQWHFVAVNRNKTTGRVEAYVDGAGVIGVVGTPNLTLNAVADLRIGKSRTNTLPLRAAVDHLQIYSVALAQDAIQAIFSRTDQGYCVAGGAKSDLSRIAWTRLKLTQQDTRGGRISVSNGLPLIIDSNAPTATLTLADGAKIQGNATTIIGGAAGDRTSGVAFVEISVNNGPWQLAEGAETWTFALTATNGAVNIRARATDRVGNLGAESAISVVADGNAPQVTLNASATTVVPTKNAADQWQVTLTGTATDAGSGIKANAIEVLLQQQSGVGPINTWQTATLTNNDWTINYIFPAELAEPTGAYDIQVRAADTVDNRTADNAATGVVRLDSSAPVASLSVVDATRQVISQTLTISGLVTDTNSIAGIDKVEIAFTPIQQVAALPANLTGDAAEALLNRTWHTVTLAQRGPGQATSSWSFQIPANLENQYQIDLRATDMLGNRAVGGYAWRGLIDTLDPRVSMSATATGATYFDAASNQQMYEIRFVCAASDRHLTEERFVCPGNALQPPVRSFTDDPSLQTLFPDMTIRSGLANTYTRWLTTTTPVASVSACDIFGRCATAASAGAAGGAAGQLDSKTVNSAAAAPGAPTAVIVNPTAGSFVAAGNAVSVTVAAEAGAKLKEVTISLDNAVVQTLSFAQTDGVTRTLRTVNVSVASEGQHSLVAKATAWDNATQTTLFPVTFTVDKAAPTLTIDASALTIADTWQPESGILRFNGAASDGVGLAAVQIREGNNPFTDAEFGNGTWQIALPVRDPEGRTLNITVRAIDRAGRMTEVAQAITTDLSAADAPDTTISSGPANPSPVNTAQFVFNGSASAVVFDCQIDNGAYTPCVSPTTYSDLSKGSHTFRVRAIDSRGFTDLSPAEYTWTVNAGQPDATITGKPANPTTERTASFTFMGDATATSFECSLDGSAYATCTSPKVYSGLGNGEHTFLVRARNSTNGIGAADRYLWTVLNAAPVANGQTVVVIPNLAKSITISATDADPLIYTIVTPPAHGVLSGLAPKLTYSPDTGYGGPDSFTFRASDGTALSNVATVTIFVDNVPPVVTCPVTPNNLWPPNHKLISIQATVTVNDVHSGPAGFTLISVTSNEPDAGLNKDDVPIDIQNWVAGTPDVVGQMRAERSDTGTGRIYTLTYEGKDRANNKARCTTTVTVPKSQGGGVVAATYDENQVLSDEYVDAQPAPADPVSAPVNDVPSTNAQPTSGEAQTQQIFLPLVTNEAVNQ